MDSNPYSTERPLKPDPPVIPPRLPSKGRKPVLADDTPCAGCKYNLKGLPIGGPCPECGRTIPAPGAFSDDEIDYLTVPQARTMRTATRMIIIGAYLMGFGFLIAWITLASGSVETLRWVVAPMLGLIALPGGFIWTMGVIVITATPSSDGQPPPGSLAARPAWAIWMARVLAPGFVVVALALTAALLPLMEESAWALTLGARIVAIAAFAGMLPLAWLLIDLHQRTTDSDVEPDALRTMMWAPAFTGFIAGVCAILGPITPAVGKLINGLGTLCAWLLVIVVAISIGAMIDLRRSLDGVARGGR